MVDLIQWLKCSISYSHWCIEHDTKTTGTWKAHWGEEHTWGEPRLQIIQSNWVIYSVSWQILSGKRFLSASTQDREVEICGSLVSSQDWINKAAMNKRQRTEVVGSRLFGNGWRLNRKRRGPELIMLFTEKIPKKRDPKLWKYGWRKIVSLGCKLSCDYLPIPPTPSIYF